MPSTGPSHRLLLLTLLLTSASSEVLHAQANYSTPYTFTTLAGGKGQGNADGAGPDARFSGPQAIAVDGLGNLYVSDIYFNDTIRRITPSGVVTTLAHIAPIPNVSLISAPAGLVVDSIGNVYVALSSNHTIAKVSPTGTVTTVAGNPTSNPELPKIPGWLGPVADPSNAGYTDGPAATARFDTPMGVVLDRAGNLFVADSWNRAIRKITPAGMVTTLAGGTNVQGLNPDGHGSAAFFGQLTNIAIDSADNLYVGDTGLNTIRKITPAGDVTTLAGKINLRGTTDGLGNAARFNGPRSLAVDAMGNIYAVDTDNATIRKITPAGLVTTLAGSPPTSYNAIRVDGTGAEARFTHPSGIAVDAAGVLYVADSGNEAIRRGVAAPAIPPQILSQPFSLSIAAGDAAVLTVAASGTNLTYGWRKNNLPIAGATQSTLALTSVSTADVANYSVAITNELGAIESSSAALTLYSGSERSRLVNLSVRTFAGTGDQTLIAGFVVGGAGQKPVLIRGIGPALMPFGVSDAVVDPAIRLFEPGLGAIDHDDDWGGTAGLASTFTATGAFALPAASHDAALLESLATGPYSVQVTSAGATGIALAEIYDAEVGAGAARIINVSARSEVGAGDHVLIAGFVIAGPTAMTVLLRGVGPALTESGVSGALSDPRLKITDAAGHLLFENDDWDNHGTLASTSASVGAFALPAASKDAAILMTLPPGVYSAQVSGVGGTTGVGLVEIYAVK